MTTVNIDETGGTAIPSLKVRRKAVLEGRRLGNAKLQSEPEPRREFYLILLIAGVFVAMGLVMVLSASSIVSVNSGGSAFTMFRKQLLWAFFGVLVAAGTYRMPYRVWQRLHRPMLVVVVVLNALPFSGLGVTVNGAHAWVAMGPVRFQPSELLKFALIIYLTNVLGRRQRELTDMKRTFVPAVFALVVAVGIVLAQRDLGAAVVLAGIAFIVLFMAGTPVRWIIASATTTLVVGGATFSRRRRVAVVGLHSSTSKATKNTRRTRCGSRCSASPTVGLSVSDPGPARASGATCRSRTATSSSP